MAAGSIGAIFGTNLAPFTASADSLPLPTSLAGVTVRVNGIEAPLFFVSALQINYQLPWEVQGLAQVSVTVTTPGGTSNAVTVSLATFGPGLFANNSAGSGQGAIAIASTGEFAAPGGSLPGRPARPANPGEFISIYCTGLGGVSNRPASGAAASPDPLSTTIRTPAVSIGGVPANVAFSGLAPFFVGLYQVNVEVPANVPAGNAVAVVLSIGSATSNTVTMAVQSSAGPGTLQIQITGLPAGVPASVSVSSSNGFNTVITASQNLQVVAGTYTIVANTVPVGNVSYGAFPVQQSVNVAPGSTKSVQVSYTAVIPQTTKTLDPPGMQNLSVSADGNTLTLPASSQVGQSLAPGNVLAVGVTPSTPNGLLRKVVSVSQSGSQIVVTTTQATLADAFQQANFTFSTTLSAQNIHKAEALLPGVTVVRGGGQEGLLTQATSVRESLEILCPGNAIILVKMFNTPIIEDQSGTITVSGEIEVCASLQFDWNIGGFPPKLNSLTATATLGEGVHVNATGTLHRSFDLKVPLARITSEPIVVFVGPVPLILVPTVTFFIGASGDVNAGFSVGVTQTASVTGGLSYNNGQLSPIFNSTNTFGPDPIGLDASLSAKAYAGETIELNIDGILSPEFSPDDFLRLDVNLLSNPWWTLSAGLEGSASVKVSLFGITDLKDFEFPNLFQFSKPIAQASGGFLPSDAAPVLSTVSPSAASVGSSDLALALTGSNFVPGATAYFKGLPLSTRFVSPNQVTATLPMSNLRVSGTFPITVTNPDTSGATSRPINFVVQGSSGSIAISSINPTSVTLTPGGSFQIVTVNLSRTNYTGTVNLSLSQLPSGVTATISQPGTRNLAFITLQAAGGAPAVSNQSVTITASGTGVSPATATFNLTVAVAQACSISISINPTSATLTPGGPSQTITVNLSRSNYTGTVNLGLSALPSGVTSTISQPGTGNSGSLTLQASASAATVSNQTITISASGTGVSSPTATFSLTVARTVTRTVSVSSQTAWTDTGLAVAAGDLITISATGIIVFDSAGRSAGPNGSTDASGSCNFLVTNAAVPAQSLVGNIANSASLDGKGFFVGSSFQATVPVPNTTTQSGRLFLGFNDGFVRCDRSGLDAGAVGDNRGAFTATVTISSLSLALSPTALSFIAQSGGANPALQTLSISNGAVARLTGPHKFAPKAAARGWPFPPTRGQHPPLSP